MTKFYQSDFLNLFYDVMRDSLCKNSNARPFKARSTNINFCISEKERVSANASNPAIQDSIFSVCEPQNERINFSYEFKSENEIRGKLYVSWRI